MSKVNIRLARSAVIALSGAAFGAAMLSACTMSDDKLARLLVAPDKYVLYSCDEIAKETQVTAAREQELLQLMAKAGTDAGGRVVSGVAYRPDYITAHGELNELRAAAAAKHCAAVPGGDTPAIRPSDGAVR